MGQCDPRALIWDCRLDLGQSVNTRLLFMHGPYVQLSPSGVKLEACKKDWGDGALETRGDTGDSISQNTHFGSQFRYPIP